MNCHSCTRLTGRAEKQEPHKNKIDSASGAE